MSIQGLSEDQIAARKEQLLQAVPASDSIGNSTLRKKLNWDEPLYWEIRNLLIDDGKLERRKGKGGSVRRVLDTLSSQAETVSTEAKPLPESQLYAPILATIKSAWVSDYRADEFFAAITAHQGSKDTGGKWSRPDITLATLNSYPLVPGKHFDVTTFEIKKHDAVDVTVVYEALAHRRAAHYSYVLVQAPEKPGTSLTATLEALADEAGRHGVGFVVLSDPQNYDTWDVWEEAERHDPDPADLSKFLTNQMSEDFKAELASWFQM